jgi:trk system potassium uptake protein TrkA
LLVVIIGCGLLGSMVANNLSRQGNSVIAIDVSESACDLLAADFSGFKILGDATQVEVLNQAKVEKSDLLMALTGDDNVNLAVSQVGKNYFHVPNVIARVTDPGREPIFKKLGIKTICPTTISVDILVKMISEVEKELT